IRKAIEDSAVTYTLGFYIDRSSLDGKFHEVKIQVKGSALTVRYPKGYFALEDVPATKDQSQTSLTTAIQSPIESSSIPMHVNVGRLDRTLPSSYGFSGSIDIHHLQLAQNGNRRTGAIDVFTVEQNETGKVLRESHERINLHFTDEEYAAKEKSGILFSKYIPPLPGATTLRILVEDSASAKVGSVIIPLSEIH
ncbi:MAG: hypothetical protein ACREDR_44895, partial [Blastocatellia bacterium]